MQVIYIDQQLNNLYITNNTAHYTECHQTQTTAHDYEQKGISRGTFDCLRLVFVFAYVPGSFQENQQVETGNIVGVR